MTIKVRPTRTGIYSATSTTGAAEPDPDLSDNSVVTETTAIPNAAGCTIVGTSAADVIVGTAGDDVICGGIRKDVIDGAGGNDVLRGDAWL